ncbi:MAG: HEAT repeat domain-containing protein [Candidatus Muiribacteriota bacterium]
MAEFLHLIQELGDQSWIKRKQASEQLKEQAAHNPEIMDELEKMLESDNDDVVFWTIQTIGAIGGQKPLELLKNIGSKSKGYRAQVALALSQNPEEESIDILLDYMGDNSWNVCNNAMNSIVNKGDPAIEKIIDCLKNASYNNAYWLTKALSKMGEKGIAVLEHFLKFNNKDVSLLVTEALGESTHEKAVDVLLKCLVDESHNVRENAVDALIKVGPDVIRPMLLFLDNAPMHVKDEVEKVIENLDGRKITVLADLLESDNRNLKMLAAEFLGKTHSKYAIEPLMKVLTDKLWLVRKSAAKGLTMIGEPTIPHLVRNLETDDENTKYWIATVLGKIGEPALPELIRMLREGSKDLRMYAVMALGEFRDEKAMFPLINALADEAWPVRNSAANALKNFGSMALVPVLKSILSQNDDIRYWSRKVFEEIAPKDIPFLVELITFSNDGELRHLVAYGLGIIQSEESIDALINALLNDNNNWVRKYAATALGKINTEKCVEPLVDMLNDPDEELAYWVAKVLGQMGENAIEKLKEGLDHPEEKVRFFSIIALGSIGDEKSIEILIKILSEEDESAQRAIKALSESNKSIPYLIEALGNPNLNIRSNASKALIKIGEPALEPLMEVVDSDNKEIHYWASKSLREIQKNKQEKV